MSVFINRGIHKNIQPQKLPSVSFTNISVDLTFAASKSSSISFAFFFFAFVLLLFFRSFLFISSFNFHYIFRHSVDSQNYASLVCVCTKAIPLFQSLSRIIFCSFRGLLYCAVLCRHLCFCPVSRVFVCVQCAVSDIPANPIRKHTHNFLITNFDRAFPMCKLNQICCLFRGSSHFKMPRINQCSFTQFH